ncbi:MAG: hypothetical protein IT371_06945 [Deltaproteobacteria bacterium]|nr:hypothetical protein [Deltaproteobacteria bacterium]
MRTKRLALGIGMGLALVGASACGDKGQSGGDGGNRGDGSGQAPDDPVARAAAKGAYLKRIEAYCAHVFKCCGAPEIDVAFKKRFTDLAGCKQYYEFLERTGIAAMEEAAGRGALGVNAAGLEKCTKAWADMVCDMRYFPPTVTSTMLPNTSGPKACLLEQVFSGKTPQGRICHNQFECAPGSSCTLASYTDLKLCRALGKDGDPCEVSSNCETGLGCSTPKAGGAPTCRPYAKDGQPCADTSCDPEVVDLFCDRDTTPDNPVCAMRRPVAGPCTLNSHCLTGLWCDTLADPTHGLCVEKRKVGEACKSGSSVETCVEGHYCDAVTTPGKAVCAAKKAEGADCTASSQCLSESCSVTTKKCVPATASTRPTCKGATPPPPP